MLLDVQADIFSGWKLFHFAGQSFIVETEPFRQIDLDVSGFDVRKHCLVCLVFFDGDDVAGFNLVRRNVDGFAVNGDVSVVYDLTSHCSGRAETQAVNDVVKSSFDENQHVFTGYATHFSARS